jgi:hypothetical protein
MMGPRTRYAKWTAAELKHRRVYDGGGICPGKAHKTRIQIDDSAKRPLIVSTLLCARSAIPRTIPVKSCSLSRNCL